MSLPDSRRLSHFLDLMTERGWDRLLFYGNAWRKDFFRYLLNVNFSGPWAIASLDRSGEIRAMFSDPWDAELLPDVGRAILPAAGLPADWTRSKAGPQPERLPHKFHAPLGRKPAPHPGYAVRLTKALSPEMAAWAAASRAIGTR
jgi:hypothetical protein